MSSMRSSAAFSRLAGLFGFVRSFSDGPWATRGWRCVPDATSSAGAGSAVIGGSAAGIGELLGGMGAVMVGCVSVVILAPSRMPLGSTVVLCSPPAFAGPRGIPLIGTFPEPAEPAGRENAAIAEKPACPPPCPPPPRANETVGGVKAMNNAIATLMEVLDMGSTTMIHWNGEALMLRWARSSAAPLNSALDFHAS